MHYVYTIYDPRNSPRYLSKIWDNFDKYSLLKIIALNVHNTNEKKIEKLGIKFECAGVA